MSNNSPIMMLSSTNDPSNKQEERVGPLKQTNRTTVLNSS